MSFVTQLLQQQKKTRTVVPKRNTIRYYKYKIEQIKDGRIACIQKRNAIKRLEDRIEALRFERAERAADYKIAIGRGAFESIELLRLENASLKDEVRELKLLLGISQATDESSHQAFIAAVKGLGCNLTGANGIYSHRAKLPFPFNQWSRTKLQDMIMQSIKFGALSRLPDGKIM